MLKFEVVHVGADSKAEAPDGVIVLLLRAVQTLPENPMGMDPKKAFAHHDEAGNVQNCVWSEVMQLDAVHAE